MRELHGYHGEHRRHARDAPAPADNPATRAHDGSRHAAQDAIKLRMLLDPEARKAARLNYQRKAEAAEADYAVRHAWPAPGDRPRTPDQRSPREPRPQHAPPEPRDQPASRFDQRERPPEVQREDGRKHQRSWLPRADMVKAVTDVGTFVTTIAVALGDASAKWEAVAATGAAAVVSNIIWANSRRKDKHGDRPEG